MCSDRARFASDDLPGAQQDADVMTDAMHSAGRARACGGTEQWALQRAPSASGGEPRWAARVVASAGAAMGIAAPARQARRRQCVGIAPRPDTPRGAPAATGSVLCLVLAAALALGGCTTSIPSVATARASTAHGGDRATGTAGKQVGTGAPASTQAAQLERVVVVFRHGVRAPLQGEAAAAHYADQPWPQWSTPASLLTPHGRQGVRLSGEYLRQWLVQQALLPSNGCPVTGSVSVWANTDQRTIDSGALLADALAPGCGILAGHREAGSNDPLFRPIEAGTVPFDAAAAVASIQQQTGGPAALLQGHAAELQALQQILGCTRTPCEFAQMPSTLAPSANGRGLKLGGPIDLTSGTGEVLLLQYAEGLPLSQVGWGRATPERLAQVSRLHALLFDIYARPHYMASRSGAPLAREVLQRFGDAQAPKVSVFVGSDTHIAALSSLLGVHFHLPGYGADDPPPGGALVLGLWRESDGRQLVRARYLAQSLDQLRTLVPLDLAHPPLQQELSLGLCAPEQRMACPLADFAMALEQQLQLDR
ncbi:histidine-type phosphatase [Xanthomonas euvesicatoria]|uniref:histidine-type phosphatase n=1 Tax=Xanthomonas euvesicatoria TaxID=456327 RepID=UPI0026E3FFBF|nr:histidine-type phosphatase [Xanthomonas euvesicatoria]MDO7931913.1 histidine-type phosphatase [Xanthomonas euvesicatoria pv. eucalypti]MDO7935177.1 histidine-type phosphatase [Xanthomonas euvesicatoria pv. eucalypti]MDO7944056.1 histidine-type phosphatase [Xanthomonas euvesicatoria pv. eucalypti]MDO7949158.1 histidine-type phosphatase [Xanthomonas euvesicatoria pv. eucalypti]MDO7961324.1 histidine-type phosphatase [Xanthomonas euvesicatoria pv. eucalypti]